MDIPYGYRSAASARVPAVEVAIIGDLDAWSAPRHADMLQDALAQFPQELIIDLTGCPAIDAAGILLLLDTHRRAMQIGGTVALRGPGAKLRRNLQLAHVERVLRIIPAHGEHHAVPAPLPHTRSGQARP